MRIPLSKGERDKLFFSAGNQPTQIAYGLAGNDVTDSFVVSLLIGRQVLLAASYYFESAITRTLVASFPRIWAAQDGRAVFFVNAQIPTFAEHGLAKRAKSPSSFAAYADPQKVRCRGMELDQLHFMATREDVDISRLLAEVWVRSCASREQGSLGAILSKDLRDEEAAAAVAACIELAETREYDFIWPALEERVANNPYLSRRKEELRRAHADMYVQAMSVTLDAIETTPTCASFGSLLSARSVGHLGLFNSVLGRVGIDVRALRSEATLLSVLEFEPLALLRDVHQNIVAAAVGAQQQASDYWRAIGLFEEKGIEPTLTHTDVRQALMTAFQAAGVIPEKKLVSRILSLERHFSGRFLSSFRDGLAALLERRGPVRTGMSNPGAPRKDVLLFTWADPLVENRGIGADREYQRVREALDSLREKSSIEIRLEPAVTIDRLMTAIIQHRPRFFHFSGHGSRTGAIQVEPADSGLLSISNILAAMPQFAKEVECAVFSACHSASGAQAIGDSIRYVILMSNALDENEAMAFAVGFYLKLGIGMSIPEAFAGGLGGLHLSGLDASLPCLYEWGSEVSFVSLVSDSTAKVNETSNG